MHHDERQVRVESTTAGIPNLGNVVGGTPKKNVIHILFIF
jgi:hypothetical protein